MTDALIVSAVRTPVGKAPNGSLRSTRPDELAATVMREVLQRAPGRLRLGDRRRHSRMRHARSRAGPQCRAHRESASGIACRGIGRHHQPVLRIRTAGDRVCRRPHQGRLGERHHRGRHREHEHGPDGRQQSRAESQRWSTATPTCTSRRASLRKITRAITTSRAKRRTHSPFAAISVRLRHSTPESSATKPSPSAIFVSDEGPRRDTSLDALAKLRPAFHLTGTVTAGNSSQMSDGAAAVLVTSEEFARERQLTPLARFVAYATAGVAPERFGTGPVPADTKSTEAGRPVAERHRPYRAERSVRLAGACMSARAADGRGASQRQRRRESRSAIPWDARAPN